MNYKSFRTLATEYDCNIATVRRTVERMKKFVGTRYPPETVVTVGREWRVEESAFLDWCRWHPYIVLGYDVPEFKQGVKNGENVFTKSERQVYRRNQISADA